MDAYYRPIVRHETPRPPGALPLAGGPGWFASAACHHRDGSVTPVALDAIPAIWREHLSAPRAPVAGLTLDRPRIMGILNITPDSFSDGGLNERADAACAAARAMAASGADLLDIGGESTRPGAAPVPADAEIARITPVLDALDVAVPLSIDTRKAAVAEAAIERGVALVNDVSGLTHDPALAPLVAARGLPVCVMHSGGDPQTMQDDPRYADVLLDVYDVLASRIADLACLGIPRTRIVVDPGIGFGKTLEHNLALLRGLALFHGLGCPILLGASRKGFIGRLASDAPASARLPGSLAVALHGAAAGVQILRVHDVGDTAQALALWRALNPGDPS